MQSLNISKIEADASAGMELVDTIKKLQTLLDKSHPGYRVSIVLTDSRQDSLPEPDFCKLSGIDQIGKVLEENPPSMELKTLFSQIESRGSKMSMPTLMSILSKYKDKKFLKVSRGVWSAR